MNTGMIPFEQVAQRAQQKAERAQQQRKIVELVELIDELSGAMSPSVFREAVRQLGYDIDACHYTLMQRGVDRTN